MRHATPNARHHSVEADGGVRPGRYGRGERPKRCFLECPLAPGELLRRGLLENLHLAEPEFRRQGAHHGGGK